MMKKLKKKKTAAKTKPDKFRVLYLKTAGELASMREIYKKLLITSAEAVFITDLRDTVLYVSDKMMQLLGVSDYEAVRGSEMSGHISQKDRDRWAKSFEKVINEGFVGSVPFSFSPEGGADFDALVNGTLVKGTDGLPHGIIGTVKDLREKKMFEEKIETLGDNYKSIFDGINDPVLLVDISTGKIIDANKITAERVRVSQETLKNASVDDFGTGEPPFSGDEMRSWIRRAATEGPQVFEWKERLGDGTYRWVELNLKKVKVNGKDCILVSSRDIDRRKLAEEELRASYDLMKRQMDGIIQAMEKLVEKKDAYTAGHERRVAVLAREIAKEIGMSEDKQTGVYMAAVIHDIGKVFVPSTLLNKVDPLTRDEFEVIKIHSQAGYDVLKSIDFQWPIAKMILQHHERENGTGYPQGLKGDAILLEARIIAVADVVEAMTFARPYRPALGIDKALAEIEKNKGMLYNIEIADACVKLFREKGYKLEA